MAKTFLDQLVDYPAKIIQRIAEDKYCVGLLVNKSFKDVSEDDNDVVLEKNIFDYQYVDDTTQETAAYIWVEVEVGYVNNFQVKNVKLYVTVACHKSFMSLDRKKFPGILGNRKDNLVRFLDRLLNNTNMMGIGKLKLDSVKSLAPVDKFSIREITYSVPDFNIVEVLDEV